MSTCLVLWVDFGDFILMRFKRVLKLIWGSPVIKLGTRNLRFTAALLIVVAQVGIHQIRQERLRILPSGRHLHFFDIFKALAFVVYIQTWPELVLLVYRANCIFITVILRLFRLYLQGRNHHDIVDGLIINPLLQVKKLPMWIEW